MIYTAQTKKALIICFKAHKEQVDKSGLPYVFHPFHLAEMMNDEITTIVALLHDVVEDSDVTIEMLRKEGFSEEVLKAISDMTHEKGVPYMEYIVKIKKNPIAAKVKLEDLRHNSDTTRLEKITFKDTERNEKYAKAIQLLME